uniref:Uncharacterized protein n=1 Tax=Arundo donax TaxID=35708 RepID=A0A0A8Z6U9_ARUDO
MVSLYSSVDSGELLWFSCRGFLSLDGYFSNHLLHRSLIVTGGKEFQCSLYLL